MKILLTAINAKYIHSNLAVYSLWAFAAETRQGYRNSVEIAEYTINQRVDDILIDLYMRKPDIVCFSCYLWNIVYVEQLVKELRKVLPDLEIWLGGPEVSFHAAEFLKKMPQVRGIMCGEGEETFLDLLEYYHGTGLPLEEITGIVYTEDAKCQEEKRERKIVANPPRAALDLDRLPFVYEDLDVFQNKIIYYESSRGCPFSCSYCLSSIDKCLRFRNIETVKQELQFFIDQEVPQVKFVDRTFNCRHDHAFAIWSYLAEHDKGKTNFHFEVAADLLREEELRLITSMRPGLIQLEIGVQSTNERTIREIRRSMKFQQVKEAVRRIHAAANIHQHLDLIAGLPYEDYESFRKSFNEVYALHPEQLQFGFLKVLKGSYMEEQAKSYGLLYQDRPPFEVLSTRWLSYEELIRLKRIEEMVEVYYNSSQFLHTMEILEQVFPDAFSMYEELSHYYERHHLYGISHSRIERYEILSAFVEEYDRERKEEYREMLTYDLYLRENVKNRPAFSGISSVTKEEETAFYEQEAVSHQYLKGYEQYDKRQMRKMTHLERVKGSVLLFDYRNRDLLTNQASVCEVSVKT
ncbi:MAG: B12-binding domain-containing radical SAM protein [Ruminococcus sp.]|nr:B12-binding domain-containing radical SAM protein [Ruminococcus sp.]